MGRHRPRRADDATPRLRRPRPAVPASASRQRSRAARRSRRSATRSSAGRSAARTWTSPRSRSRSTIPPTTGSPWARRPASRSARRARRRPRRGRRARSASPRSSCPTIRARTMPFASSSIALVRQGVTSTVSRHDGHRYGVLHIDSNLPDVRLAIGGPTENRVRRGRARRRRSRLSGRARPAAGQRRLGAAVGPGGRRRPSAARNRITDLRGARDLPVLIVAGVDADHDGRGDRRARRRSRRRRHRRRPAGGAGRPDRDDGGLHRRRPQPGHAELQRRGRRQPVPLDHALVQRLAVRRLDRPAATIDARRRELPVPALEPHLRVRDRGRGRATGARAGSSRPATSSTTRSSPGRSTPTRARLPATAGFLEVEPASVVLTVLKPAGDPQARMAGMELDPAHGIALRLYESSGRPDPGDDPQPVADRGRRPDEPARGGRPGAVEAPGPRSTVRLEPYEIVTVAATLEATRRTERRRGRPGPARRGRPAGLLGLLAAQQGCRPDGLPAGHGPDQAVASWAARGRSTLPIVVASERTDGAAAGSVALIVPPGWVADAGRADLPPGAGRAPGLRGLRSGGRRGGRPAAISWPRGSPTRRARRHEDVVTIDYQPGGDGTGPQTPATTSARPRLAGRSNGRSRRPASDPSRARPAWPERRTTGVARSRSSCSTARSRRRRAAAPRSACRSRTRRPARSAARRRS